MFHVLIGAQAIRDNGKPRKGVTNSGPGHCDPDDTVLAERWARLVVVKEAAKGASQAPAFRVLMQDVAGR